VALSPGIESALAGQKTGLAIHRCTNMSDCEFFGMEEQRDRELQKKYHIGDEFIIGYFGAIGKLNALGYLLDAVKTSKEKKANIKFLIIGNGAEKPHLESIANKNDLDNVIFVDHLDKYELKKHLTLIDAAYISFASFRVLESNSPNKFFDALAAGKMIILNIKGWLKENVENNHCGFYADPKIPDEFLEKLGSYIADRSLLKQCQQNARRLAESEFEMKKLTAGLLKFIEEH
jgi:glycosyltransferase involved in cell wall biosynthesis